MILSAHQPAYLPWFGYIHKIALADQFVLLDAIQFEKNSFTNRNKIKTSNGDTWLTIPVEMKDHLNKNLNELNIDSKQNWKKKHWTSIFFNYKKTPFFNQYADFLNEYYQLEITNLSEFIQISTNYFLKELKIETPTIKLSELNIESKKQELIIDICKATNSSAFVFGAMGKDYADLDYFKQHQISIYFQEYKHPIYTQLHGDFSPYMTILDALFNLGSERTKELLFEGNMTKTELKKVFSK